MVAVFDEPPSEYWAPGLAFHQSLPLVSTLGEKDTAIRIWGLDYDVVLGERPMLA